MNLWFRLIYIVLAGLLRERVAWDAVTTVSFRVWPTDLDINMHMTNSRYLALMDLGRTNLIFQSGLMAFLRREKLAPVIAGSLVRFRRPLKLFEKITLTTQVIGWDAKWIFIDQRVMRGGELACQAMVKAVFLSKAGSVAPELLAKGLGQHPVSPLLPGWIKDWLSAESAAAQMGKSP